MAPRRVFRVTLGVVALVVLALTSTTFGQAVDPIIGTWKQNLEKAEGEPRQRSVTMKFDKTDAGRRWSLDIVLADGTRVHRVSPANDDGKEYPVTGSPGTDAIVLKRIDAFTWTETLKNAGKPTFVGGWVLSKDGKVLTISSSVRKYVRVYEKQ